MTRRRPRGGAWRPQWAAWAISLLAPVALPALGGCEFALLPATSDETATVESGTSDEVGQSEVEEAGLDGVTGTVPAGASVEGVRDTALGRTTGPGSGLEPPQTILVTLPTTAPGSFPGTLPGGGGGPAIPPPGPPPPAPPPPAPPPGGIPGGSFGSAPGAGAGAGAGTGVGFGAGFGAGLGAAPR